MRFKADIELGNDACSDAADVAVLLRKLASHLDQGLVRLLSDDGSWPSGAIRDINGNKVGTWEVTEEE